MGATGRIYAWPGVVDISLLLIRIECSMDVLCNFRPRLVLGILE
jgi:hypothetical protein